MLRNASDLPVYDASGQLLKLQENNLIEQYLIDTVAPDSNGIIMRLDPGVQGILNTLALREHSKPAELPRDNGGVPRRKRNSMETADRGRLIELSAAKSE